MPAPTVATPSQSDSERSGVTSMTTSPAEDRPAKQWPPQRGVVRSPNRRANLIVRATSLVVAARTTARGPLPWKRASAGLAASS
jgi:hypothetical protein